MSANGIKIGIMAEKGTLAFRWQALRDAIAGADICFFTEVPTQRRRRRWRDLPARLLWRIINRIEAIGADDAYERWSNAGTQLRFGYRGHYKVFLPGETEKVRNEGVDLLIRLGGHGIYRDSILSVAPLGLISVHHGDNRLVRGGPPGFWEIMNRHSQCGYIVQRLTPMLDNGAVLARGEVPTGKRVVETRLRLFAAADVALANLVRGLLANGVLPPLETEASTVGPIYRMPGLRPLLRYVLGRPYESVGHST